MADVESANIRGLEIDKIIQAVTYTEYVFKSLCRQAATKSNSIRWYAKTSPLTLTATSPSFIANISPLSTFQTVETAVTRNTSYVRKYGVTDMISIEDIDGADVDMLAITVMELTRAVIKQVDSRIWAVITNQNSAGNIPAATSSTAAEPNMVATSGAWTSAAGDPIRDLLQAQRTLLVSGGYTQTPTIVLSPTDYANLIVYLVTARGSSIPSFASSVAQGGRVLELAGMPIMTSVNVTADYAVALIPQVSATWKSFYDTTSVVIDHPGLGKEIRVWEEGEAILTDPRSVCIISNTQ